MNFREEHFRYCKHETALDGIKCFFNSKGPQGINSVVEHLPSIAKAMVSVPSTKTKQTEKASQRQGGFTVIPAAASINSRIYFIDLETYLHVFAHLRALKSVFNLQ